MNATRLYKNNLDSPHNLPYRDLTFSREDISGILGSPSSTLSFMEAAFSQSDYERAGVLAVRLIEMENWDKSSKFVVKAYSNLRRIVEIAGVDSFIGEVMEWQKSETAQTLDKLMKAARDGLMSAGMSPQELIEFEYSLDNLC